MGLYHRIKKDNKVRSRFKKYELRFILFKYLNNNYINSSEKFYLNFNFMKKFHLNASFARIVNRCVYTGRARWTLRNLKMSRITFRKFADNAELNGVKRASW